MGAVLALAASVLWGSGDFLGGSLSRRAHPLAVMGAAQALALVGIVVVAAATGELDASGYLPWGVAGGLVGVVALGSFYTALATGTMGVVAPIASTGVVVPVAVGVVAGDDPTLLQGAGIVIAVVGVILASGPSRATPATERQSARPFVLAGLASVGFGAALVLVAEGSEHSVIMTLATMRIVNASVCAVILAAFLRGAVRPGAADVRTLAVIGTTDTAANGAYALATSRTLVSVAAVLASLYPAVTVLLARRFHHERLRPVQGGGVLLTLAGVALIAGGGS